MYDRTSIQTGDRSTNIEQERGDSLAIDVKKKRAEARGRIAIVCLAAVLIVGTCAWAYVATHQPQHAAAVVAD